MDHNPYEPPTAGEGTKQARRLGILVLWIVFAVLYGLLLGPPDPLSGLLQFAFGSLSFGLGVMYERPRRAKQ